MYLCNFDWRMRIYIKMKKRIKGKQNKLISTVIFRTYGLGLKRKGLEILGYRLYWEDPQIKMNDTSHRTCPLITNFRHTVSGSCAWSSSSSGWRSSSIGGWQRGVHPLTQVFNSQLKTWNEWRNEYKCSPENLLRW